MLKSFFATIAIFVASIFGGHTSDPVATAPSQPAAPAVAVFSNESASTSAVTRTQSSSPSAATTTVINQYITQPVIERTVQTVAAPLTGYVSESEFTTKLDELSDRFGKIISGSTYPAPASTLATGGVWNAIAATNKIDQLSGTSITNATVHGLNGLTDADIPDTITASNYMPLGGTTSGNVGVGTTSPETTLHVIGSVRKVGTISLGTRLGEIRVAGKIAYVLETGVPAKPYVLDLSNPAIPSLITTSASTNGIGCCGVAFDISGKYAYVLGWSASWGVFDISNPGNLKEMISSNSIPGLTPRTISVVGRYAYIGTFSSGALKIYDISDPTVLPRAVGSLSVGGNIGGVVVQGHYAYVKNDGSNTFQVVDVSNPSNPSLVGSVSTDSAGFDDFDMAHTECRASMPPVHR